MRKDSGFNVTDHIKVCISENEKIASIIKKNEAEIAAVVLGDKFEYDAIATHSKEWDINGNKVTISVEVL